MSDVYDIWIGFMKCTHLYLGLSYFLFFHLCSRWRVRSVLLWMQMEEQQNLRTELLVVELICMFFSSSVRPQVTMLQPSGGAVVTRNSRPRKTKTRSQKAALLASSQNRHLQVSWGWTHRHPGMLSLFPAFFLVWVNIHPWKSERMGAEVGS